MKTGKFLTTAALFLIVSILLLTTLEGKKSEKLNLKKESDPFLKKRQSMVSHQLVARNITNKRVLKAMLKVPRHIFVPSQFRQYAYGDYPLPIGFGQTISQPYIVAYMSQQIAPQPSDKILEIGTGSGYQTTILAEIAREVYTIELIAELSHKTETVIKKLGYKNVHFKVGNGWEGWPEAAPFDAIIVTAAADILPQNLITQLKSGGRIVLPLGKVDEVQYLTLVIKKPGGRNIIKKLIPVRFVPFVHPNSKAARQQP